MTHVRVLFLLLLVAAFSGCENTPSEVIDLSGSAPVLRSASVSPTLFNLDHQQPTGGLYLLSTVLTAVVSDPQGVDDIQRVEWTLYGPSLSTPMASGVLTPVASPPGSPTRTYSSGVSMQVQRSALGNYAANIVAVDGSALRSANASLTITVRVTDLPPVLTLPGARYLGTGGVDSSRFALTVFAADPSGLSDIVQVKVRALASRDSSALAMYDDGSRNHGDVTAGDGVFSAYAWVIPTSSLQDVVFEYRANDRAGTESNILRRSANNQSPRFTSLTVPSVIQRPSSGTSLVSFYASVEDPNGRQDIDSVYFKNLSSTTPTPFLMYDDGDLTQHGDSVAADGRYSVVLSITSTNSTGVKEFRFSAVDRAGARADTTRFITIN